MYYTFLNKRNFLFSWKLNLPRKSLQKVRNETKFYLWGTNRKKKFNKNQFN